MNGPASRNRFRRPASSPPAPTGRSRRELFRPLSGNAYSKRREMRRPGTSDLAPEAPLVPPAMAVLALTRLGFGPTVSDIAAFNALGGNDLARLTAWVDQQLDPAAIPDAACDARLAASGFSTLEQEPDAALSRPPRR